MTSSVVPRSGRDASHVLPDGRVVEYWEGGDPAGRTMIVHHGSPSTRLLGQWGHEAAVAAGVRLVSVNRPGYGGSTVPSGAPSLIATGRDTAALAAHLGVGQYAVFGQSGGGPFAMATALAIRATSRALGHRSQASGRGASSTMRRETQKVQCLALMDVGDVAGATDCMRRDIKREFDRLAAYDDVTQVEMFLAGVGEGSRLSRMPAIVRCGRVTCEPCDGSEGFAFDNLAWGATGTSTPATSQPRPSCGTAAGACGVSTPARPLVCRADRITGSELVVLAGETHIDVASTGTGLKVRGSLASGDSSRPAPLFSDRHLPGAVSRRSRRERRSAGTSSEVPAPPPV